MHRNLAYLILVLYIYIFFQVYRKKIKTLYRSINIIGILLFVQILLGILTLIYGAQIKYASMHQLSSIFLVSSVIYFIFVNNQSNLQLSN